MLPLDADIRIADPREKNRELLELQAEKKKLTKKIETGIVAIVCLILMYIRGVFQLNTVFSTGFVAGYTLVMCVFNLGCIGYVRVNPRVAMTAPLVVLVVVYIFWALVHPAFLVVGVLYKLVIGAFLFRARSAADHMDMVGFQIEEIEKKMVVII